MTRILELFGDTLAAASLFALMFITLWADEIFNDYLPAADAANSPGVSASGAFQEVAK